MTATALYIPYPMMPELGARRVRVPAGCTAQAARDALVQEGLNIPFNTVLLRPDMASEGASPADVFVRRADWAGFIVTETRPAVFVTLPLDGGASSAIAMLLAKLASASATALATAFPATFGGTILWGTVSLKALTTSLIFAGGSALVSSLLPAPKQGNTSTASNPTYSLSAQSDSFTLGEPIPEAIGRNKIPLKHISQPYFDFVDNKQRITQILAGSMGDFDIDEIHAVDAVVWKGGTVTAAYPELEIEICPPGTPITLCDDNVVTSSEVNALEMLGTNEESYRSYGPFIGCKAGKRGHVVEFDIQMAGCFSLGGDGHLDTATVSFKFWGDKIDDAGNVIAGSQTDLLIKTLTMSTRDAVRKTFRVTLPTPGRWRFFGQRTNEKSTDNNTTDTLQWLALRVYLPSQLIYPKVTVVVVRAMGTANLNGSALQSMSMIATRKLPEYNPGTTSWSAPVATRKIAAGFSYLARSIGERADAKIDLAMLWSLNTTWEARGDRFDYVFTARKGLWQDGFEPLLRVGRARPMMVGDLLTMARDEPKVVYDAGSFSPLNMTASGGFEMEYDLTTSRSVDAIIVKYLDADTFTEKRVLCKLASSDATIYTAPEVSIDGITSRAQAYREGMFMVADSFFRRRRGTFQTCRDGALSLPGQRGRLTHWQPKYGASAELMELQQGETVVIDGHTVHQDILTLSEPWSRPVGAVGENLIDISVPARGTFTKNSKVYGPVPFELLDDGADTGHAVVKLLSLAVVDGEYALMQPRDWPLWSGRDLQKRRPRCGLGVGTMVGRDIKVSLTKPGVNNRFSTLTCFVDDPRVYTADQGEVPSEIDTAGNANLVIGHIAVSERTLIEGHRYGADFTITGEKDATTFNTDAVDFEAQYRTKKFIIAPGTAPNYVYGAWQPIIAVTGRSFGIDTFITELGVPPMVDLRVRAKNVNGKYGPWFDVQFYADGTEDSAPANCTNIKASRAWDKNAKEAITFTCDQQVKATSYLIQIVARVHGSDSWSVWREQEIDANKFTYYFADQTNDGGPFNNCYAKFKAKNSVGTSPDWVGSESNYP